MYGQGAAPPSRSAATVISLRVLFAAAGVLTCGFLACVPLFRVAFLRGRALDWAAAWVSLPLSIACFAVIGVLPESDFRTDIALAVIMLLGVGAAVWFLIVDIGHHSAPPRQFAGYAPPHAPTVPTQQSPQSPYGYPHPTSPYTPSSTPVPQPPSHQPPQHPVPPSPQRPAPARIDQVRAELDELSDYLRRQDGRPDGAPGDSEGGR
ncbi:integral membrane protein [Streptomyces viridochromogenes DSM 40736]|uniref:Integral membrane protein n=1 Tax=Streptomyces viridochromogenes (strain DSM 40736 / JCM 4977 / BCRC 1201 / Tue 494) TaxID=591159 RepID=D9XFG4_STRVT|nr:hypothetical protein [Streptomyces viridochromogenes]EFL32667.1 integral membrane protein [Streptomyces viridochromogenes DSM 40736]